MDQVANLPAEQRAELFQEAGSRRGTGSAVTEKDFWVCWVLKGLFADPAIKEHIVIKGGTTPLEGLRHHRTLLGGRGSYPGLATFGFRRGLGKPVPGVRVEHQARPV